MSLSKARQLREQRANIHTQATELLDRVESEDRNFNDEEQASWDRMHQEMNDLLARAERLERAHDEDLQLRDNLNGWDRDGGRGGEGRGGPGGAGDAEQRAEAEARAFERWCRFGMDGLDPEQRQIMVTRQAEVTPEMRAQTVTTSGGGYLIPEGFRRTLEDAMLQYGGVRRSRATVLRTDTGNDLPMPTANDTSNKGEIIGINTQHNQQDVTFGRVVLGAYMYSSKIVLVPFQLLQDSAFNLDTWLPMKLGERIGRIQSDHDTTGTGSSQPNGVVTASTAGKTAASSSAVTHDELLDLKHSVDPAYRQNAEWMLHDNTLLVIKKLKDSQNRPLWAPGISVREPDRIDGDPYVVNQSMPTMEASAKSILYGDFSKFMLRDVTDVMMLRLTERYADYLQVGFLAFQRHDADLLDAGTNPIKHLVHPSP